MFAGILLSWKATMRYKDHLQISWSVIRVRGFKDSRSRVKNLIVKLLWTMLMARHL